MATDPAQRPPTIDPAAAARWGRSSPGPTSPWLHEEVGRRMAERLQWITRRPKHWIDWSPLRGGLEAHARVAAHYPEARALVVEPVAALEAETRRALAAPWWSARRRHAAKAAFDPPPPGGVDLLWANMGLHMAADPQALIARWHRLVAVDGFLMFSCLGPDTVRELRAIHAREAWGPASHAFTDMHDWGDMLVHAGFAEPVMDMERIELTWPDPAAALRELRTLGRNLHPGRFPALRGRRWRETLLGRLATDTPASQDGRVGLCFEIVYGHAFKPAPRAAVAAESAVGLEDMRAMLRRGRPRT